MKKIPKAPSWADTLSDFEKKAEALPPGIARNEIEVKIARLKQAIRLRNSFANNLSVHKEHRDGQS